MAPHGAQNGASIELQQHNTAASLATAPSTMSSKTTKGKKDNFAKRLYRQNLRGYVPIPSPPFAIGFFSITGTVLLAIGIAVLTAALSVNVEEIRYDNQGTINGVNLATATLSQANSAMLATNGQGQNVPLQYPITTDLKAPVYVYYKIGNFYQNYRRYINSVSWTQVHGDNVTSLSACDPLQFVYGNSSGRFQNSDFPNNGGTINPCGLWSWSYFNDTFAFRTNGASIPVSASNLAWSWQRDKLFGSQQSVNFNNNTRFNNGTAYTATIGGAGIANNSGLNQDERFMVWMRPEAHYTITKLWGVINQDIKAGTVLNIDVQNRYNTYGWGGAKTVVLSENSWMGGRNTFLGALMITIGGLYYVCALVFVIGRMVHHRPMGDERYLSWHRMVEKRSVMQGIRDMVRR